MQHRHHPLNVLISAYACEPGKGSEPGVAWNLAKELSTRVTLWIITRANNRSVIEASGEPWIEHVHWIYWDPPAWLTFWKKGSRGVQLFYMLWQIGIYRLAQKIVINESIDVCHHLTFGRYWVPSRLADLPVPFVFGPIGGGEETPPGLTGGLSHGGWLAEKLKRLVSRAYPRLPWNSSLYRKAAWTFAATGQTAEKLIALGVQQMNILPQSGIAEEELPVLPTKTRSTSDPLILVTACRLIHWKAVDLAIEALALASREIDVRLIILQNGPELPYLKKLANRLGVSDCVEFRGRLPSLNDVYQAISEADALVHPALHEAFGQACLESLALGIPVICLNWGGPGLIVDETSGFAVEPGNREETIQRLAAAMVRLDGEIANSMSRAEACRKRAYGTFHWDRMAEEIIRKYAEITP